MHQKWFPPIQCVVSLWTAFALWPFCILKQALAQAAGPGEKNSGVLRTAGDQELISLSLSLEFPQSLSASVLQFDFGFGTEESQAEDFFYDSFSIMLQNSGESTNAFLLTADATGPVWAPANPPGLALSPETIRRQEIAFDSGQGNFGIGYSYSVEWPLPPEFAGGTGLLFFDLFNNQNDLDSLAYFNHVTIVPGQVPPVSRFTLQSSASPAGPYADENDIQIDAALKIITLPRFAGRRFFRLSSEAETKMSRMWMEESDLVFQYEFTLPRVVLQGASRVEGSYRDLPSALVDLQARTITLVRSSDILFYRLQANARTRIGSVRFGGIEGDLVIISFDFQPTPVRLQSSAQATGPYADEQNVRIESATQTMRVPQLGSARFYRFRSGDPRVLLGLRAFGDTLEFRYGIRGTDGD